MLTQEEYTDVLKLQRQGFTIAEIADELGYHPATISRWIKEGGPPPRRGTDRSEMLRTREGDVRTGPEQAGYRGYSTGH